MRAKRVAISSTTYIRWPACNTPLAFGGGIMIEKGFLDESPAGLKDPESSQSLEIAASWSAGLYALLSSGLVEDFIYDNYIIFNFGLARIRSLTVGIIITTIRITCMNSLSKGIAT